MREPLAEPARRGHLEVRDVVLDRVACRAAASVTGVVPGTVGRLTRRRLPHVDSRSESRPDGPHARLRVDVAVAWGHRLDAVAARVQSVVAERVEHLTSVRVDQVDVTVDDLLVPDEPASRRVL